MELHVPDSIYCCRLTVQSELPLLADAVPAPFAPRHYGKLISVDLSIDVFPEDGFFLNLPSVEKLDK